MHRVKARAAWTMAAIAGLLGIGTAFAAWTSFGTGQGPTTAASAAKLSVDVGDVNGLFPTGTVRVPFTVTNDMPYAIKLQRALPGAFSVDEKHPGCKVDGVISGADVALDEVLAAGASSSGKHTVAISMSNAAVDACQGATFSFDLVVTGVSTSG